MPGAARYDETITLPRAVRFPIELLPPEGFDEERLETWPRVAGRLEYVEGRLLFSPPSGDVQQDVVTDVVITLGAWTRTRAGFVLGTNEAGMRLAGSTRAADAALSRGSQNRPLLGIRRRPFGCQARCGVQSWCVTLRPSRGCDAPGPVGNHMPGSN